MRPLIALALTLLVGLGIAHGASDHVPHEVDFTYKGARGPANWARLSDEWLTCGTGRRQSPIDLDGATATDQLPLTFRYRRTALTVEDVGHTIDFFPAAGDALQIGRRTVGKLVQLHFHSRSEHHLGNRSYPMEFHFVHADAEKRLTVVGVLVETGAANAAAAGLLRDLPAETAEPAAATFDPRGLLPRSHRSIRYSGSLTTPPCTEGVQWVVLTTPVTLSARQIARFRERYTHNNRPLQPRGGRRLTVG